MHIANVKAESTSRTGLQHTYAHNHTDTHTIEPLTWQHDIRSLLHSKHVDGSTVH